VARKATKRLLVPPASGLVRQTLLGCFPRCSTMTPPSSRSGPWRELSDVISEARSLGFLGPGPIDVQLRHAAGFVSVARSRVDLDARILDLGSGGGLPGLVVASEWPEATLTLLDANGRRTAFLHRALERFELADRVTVVQERAENAGRLPDLRARFDVVMARSFGRPAVVAECGAPFLKRGGWLVVSEPPASIAGEEIDPESVKRWPPEPLHHLGLEPVEAIHAAFQYQTLRQQDLCPDRYPRRNGVPARKPLF
jgi:16S rRNA (guanine527-N7)-methyltransferase